MSTPDVLQVVRLAYEAQEKRWGLRDYPDTYQQTGFRSVVSTASIDAAKNYRIPSDAHATDETRQAAKGAYLTWGHLLVELTARIVARGACGDAVALRAKLVELAALAVHWIEAIDRRTAPKAPEWRWFDIESGYHHGPFPTVTLALADAASSPNPTTPGLRAYAGEYAPKTTPVVNISSVVQRLREDARALGMIVGMK